MWLTYRASLLLLAVALVGCASEKISVRPRLDSGAAIGEGLDAPFFVVVVSCGGFGDCIEDGSVSELEAKVDDEGVAELLDVSEGGAGAGFTLRGVSAGETSVELATAIDDASFEVQVAEVAASRL